MSKEPTLAITIEGVEYVAPRPRMKILKTVMRFRTKYDAGEIDLLTADGIDEFFILISNIMGHEKITPETLEELEIQEFSKVFTVQSITSWINAQFPQKKVIEADQIASMRKNQKAQKNKKKQ